MKRFYVLFATLLSLNVCGPPVMYAQEGEVVEVGEDQIGDAEIPETIAIRDSNLSAAIRSTLGLATDATLTATNMLDLKSLQAKEAEISDLSGLEHATNLTTLNLYGNQLTDLSPLSGLESLISLDLGKNTITNIEALKALTALTTLHLDRNQLTDFRPLSSLTEMSILHLSRTGISDLSALGSLTQLTQLYLTGNEISDIGALSDLTALGWLFLAQNEISDVSPLVGMEALVSLRLLGNPVSNASVLYGLTQGSLIDVDIEILPPADTDPPSVSIAVPSDTQKSAFDVTITFSEAVSGFEQADLTLSGTATASITGWLTTDDTVFTATITPTTSGEMVVSVIADVARDAASNNNTASDPQTVTVDMDAPRVSISVPEGVQNDVFDVVITFTERVSGFEQSDLSVSGTAIASITAWQGTDDTIWTATLTPTTSGTLTLRIAEGAVTDTVGNPNVLSTAEVSITLNVPDDTEVSLAVLVSVCDRTPQVRTAIVAAVGVSDCANVTAADLASITDLNLKYQNIAVLKANDFNGLTALERLDLMGNKLSSLPAGIFDELTTLEYLDLDHNTVRSLPAGIFDELTALETLELHNNKFSSLPAGIFDELTALKWLDLSSNRLNSLPAGIFNGLTALKGLDLSNNPGDPLRVKVSLKEVGEGEFKATAHTGAPFDIVLPLVVTNGSIEDGGTLRITISTGTVESESVTVTRTPGTVDAVSVDIGTLPFPPGGIYEEHLGFRLVKSRDLPLTVIEGLGAAAPGIASGVVLPSETTLSANYPNPFNPETWIPYQLANPSDVVISIYDGRGQVVRRLELGHQPAGYYTNRSRAAYWDGRNDFGERVSSGLYFYQLKTDNLSLLRKMLILK